jgi:hypothetical protein
MVVMAELTLVVAVVAEDIPLAEEVMAVMVLS